MPEKQLTKVDERVLRALEMRAEGASWHRISSELGWDRANMKGAIEARGVHETLPKKLEAKREYFAQQAAAIVEEAQRRLLDDLERTVSSKERMWRPSTASLRISSSG